MKRISPSLWITLLILAALAAACSPGSFASAPTSSQSVGDSAAADTLRVAVSIVPQQYFVQRIGGEHVLVDVMVPPGANPHTYEPKPEQMAGLSDTAAYFSIGVDFEEVWLEKIAASNPNMLVVDTTEGIEKLPMVGHDHQDEEEADHTEEGADDHEHAAEEGRLDPHIWTSPSLVKTQSQSMYETLVELDPAHKEEYRANLDAFTKDIDALDAEIRQTLENAESRQFIVFHPAWGYFARDYGLEMVPIEVGGVEPSAAEIAEIITVAQDNGIRVIFAQPETSTATAEMIASEIGGEVLLISPLAPDWLDNMRRVAQLFDEALD
jgi:zinc transport system substrate-binding protein